MQVKLINIRMRELLTPRLNICDGPGKPELKELYEQVTKQKTEAAKA